MNELERIEQLINRLYSRVSLAKKHKVDKVTVDIILLEEIVAIISDSLRTVKEYNLQPFDHTLPVPPKGLTDDRSIRRIPEKEKTN